MTKAVVVRMSTCYGASSILIEALNFDVNGKRKRELRVKSLKKGNFRKPITIEIKRIPTYIS